MYNHPVAIGKKAELLRSDGLRLALVDVRNQTEIPRIFVEDRSIGEIIKTRGKAE